MDNKRMVLAIALSIGVLVLWNFFFTPKNQQVVEQQTASQPEVAGQEQVQTTRAQTDPAQVSFQDYTADGGESLVVETPLYRAVVNTSGGILEHFVLKKYKTSIEPDAEQVDLIRPASLGKAPMGLIWNQTPTWKQAAWSATGEDLNISGQESGRITLRGEMNGVSFIREFTFKADSYGIEEQTTVVNELTGSTRGTLGFTMSSMPLTTDDNQYNRTKLVYHTGQALEEEEDTDDLSVGILSEVPVSWGGIASNYFLLSVLPQSGNSGLKGKFEDGVYRVALAQDMTVQAGEQQTLACTYYLGPKIDGFLTQASPKLDAAINYGWFDFIAKPLMKVLKFFYAYVGNYGIAIILLTVLIKIAFWPLSHKSYKSMEKMKKLQPMMAKLREKYKDDKQKLNQELMGLYKTYKVNPAGGCLPMLLQIPVFIALYQGLLGAIELRHAAFIKYVPFTDIYWLADLSAKDPFYITPIVMGATMFLQQKMSPAPGDPTQAKIMLFMPVIFTFIFLNFPAGLVVYWLINNILSIAQQWWMIRKA